ncbi:carbon-nitrogen hydrolase [Piedraia hortae CBS 480.64]|uniref:Carbon-nitrogen hydrolase n=1 Tax=Piedraia hortae CBS 480.64 TaxID=1314780 RepID=A0A6A7C4F3_9PEZI|nr:carbon-nitrogen hydrolase [Piedraia hortae CBS 480.64]
MCLALLQFAPELGKVEENIRRADELLRECAAVDLLVLPEMAFSGYNFPSRDAIEAFLEPSAAGPTTQWAVHTAQRLHCHVLVGYPERTTSGKAYNAAVTVGPNGDVVAHHRKTFLYYTDETWAETEYDPPSGPPPFYCAPMRGLGDGAPIGVGICMDINPHRFEAPWAAYEFANAMVSGGAKLVVLSMAWLAQPTQTELPHAPDQPDLNTITYWINRFVPLLTNDTPVDVVFANRCGSEDTVTYAGSSCVMRFNRGSVSMYSREQGGVAVLGRNEEGLLIVDTSTAPPFSLVHA